jgi:hypothetical protein
MITHALASRCSVISDKAATFYFAISSRYLPWAPIVSHTRETLLLAIQYKGDIIIVVE